MPAANLKTRVTVTPFQGFAHARRIADAVKVQVGRRSVAIVIGLVSVAAVALLFQRTGTRVISAAATPDWRFLLAGLAICAAVQPLRALAWTSTALAVYIARKPMLGERRRLVPRHGPARTARRSIEGRGAQGHRRPATFDASPSRPGRT